MPTSSNDLKSNLIGNPVFHCSEEKNGFSTSVTSNPVERGWPITLISMIESIRHAMTNPIKIRVAKTILFIGE